MNNWIVVIVCLLGIVGVYGSYTTMTEAEAKMNAYVEACETMGGVPVYGIGGTKLCVKPDSIVGTKIQ